MSSIEQLVDQSTKLGTLPAIVSRIFDAMDDPNSTAAQIGRVINDDPALTGRLLKLVNSPFYGFTSKVDTVYRAIALIGHRELRSVVLAASAVKVFTGIPEELISMPVFWRRSLYTAVTARVIAAFRREKEIERFFIAGLLHDIGSLLLFKQMPDQMTFVLSQQKNKQIPINEAEMDEFGFDHAELGGALLKKWSLPPMLFSAVHFHLAPEKAPAVNQDAAWVVHLAWQIVRHHIDRDPLLGEDDEIDEKIWQANNLDSDLLEKILEKAEQQFQASKDIIN